MTRLRSEDMAATAIDLQTYDSDLQHKVGTDLKGLACGAAGIDEAAFSRRAAAVTAAVVPITSGGGIIPGFSEGVRRILAHIGITAFVTAQADVAGLAEAYQRRCKLILLADDFSFIAVRTRHRKVVHNAAATGMGYAWGLNQMAGGVRGKPVLVIGCGPVGCSAAAKLVRLGAIVCVQDKDPVKARRLSVGINYPQTLEAEENLAAALMRHTLIVDATPAADIIGTDAVGPATFISAPGVPIGLTAEALMKTSSRVLHDLLEIGVATMAAIALGKGET